MSNISYYMPTKIIFEDDSIKTIDKYIDNRKTILITSEGFVKRGLVNRLKSYSKNIIKVVSNIKSHPEFKDLEKIYEEIYAEEFELILAFGGGSVLDASKFFSLCSKDKKASFVTNIIKGKTPKENYSLTPIISIPTTAGTSSEITPWATIWDMEEKKKYSLHLPKMFSEIAIYDPILTLSIPKNITIQTGLDSLSHSLESIWNKNANEITISNAIKASKLIVEYLPLLVNDLNNLEYRRYIMKACMYSGLAFSNTQTALSHAMSYYITAHKGVPHGIACSFTLPLLIDNIIGKYDFIDKALKEIFNELSSNKLRKMLDELNVSTEFLTYGIDIKEFETLKNSLNSNQRAGNSLVKL